MAVVEVVLEFFIEEHPVGVADCGVLVDCCGSGSRVFGGWVYDCGCGGVGVGVGRRLIVCHFFVRLFQSFEVDLLNIVTLTLILCMS